MIKKTQEYYKNYLSKNEEARKKLLINITKPFKTKLHKILEDKRATDNKNGVTS